MIKSSLDSLSQLALDHYSQEPHDFIQVFAENSSKLVIENVDIEKPTYGMSITSGISVLKKLEGRTTFQSLSPDRISSMLGVGFADSVLLDPVFDSSRVERSTVSSIQRQMMFMEEIRTFSVCDSTGTSSNGDRRRKRISASLTVEGHRVSARFFGKDAWVDLDTKLPLLEQRVVDSVNFSKSGYHNTPVIFSGTASAGLIHELIGHALEADSFNSDASYIHRVNLKEIHPELVVKDDPHIEDGYGSYEFDDDGGRPKTRILFSSSGMDQISGLSDTGSAGGNGRRQDFRFPTLSRASNTVISSGSSTSKDIFSSKSKGYLHVNELGSGSVNVVSGFFKFSALTADWITPDGLRVPVLDAHISGYALDVLRKFAAIGDSISGSGATCGKFGQFLGIGLYGPDILVESVDWKS